MKKIIYKISLTILTIILFTTSCVIEPQQKEELVILPPRIHKQEIISFFADLPFDSESEIKIALMLPLTGKHEKIGQDLYKAAQLALFDHGDPRIVIYPYDTEASEFKSISLMDEIIENKVKIIIGPIFSKNVKSIKPLVKANNIKVFTFSNNTDVAGDGVYVLGVDVKQQISRLVDYATDNGYEYFSAIAPANHYGSDAVKQLRISAKDKAMILKSEFYNSDNSLKRSVRKVLKSMQESPVNEKGLEVFKELTIAEINQNLQLVADTNKDEVIYDDLELLEPENLKVERLEDEHIYRDIHDYKRALLLADSARNLETISNMVSVDDFIGEFKLLGTSLMGNKNIYSNKLFEDAWFTDLPHENIINYEHHFMTTYNYVPEDISVFAYDMVSVISALASYNEVYNISYLESKIGFSGVSGVFRFNNNGIVERLFEIYEIRDGIKNTVDPAQFQFKEPITIN